MGTTVSVNTTSDITTTGGIAYHWRDFARRVAAPQTERDYSHACGKHNSITLPLFAGDGRDLVAGVG